MNRDEITFADLNVACLDSDWETVTLPPPVPHWDTLHMVGSEAGIDSPGVWSRSYAQESQWTHTSC